VVTTGVEVVVGRAVVTCVVDVVVVVDWVFVVACVDVEVLQDAKISDAISAQVSRTHMDFLCISTSFLVE
jgi:hypothetical protein